MKKKNQKSMDLKEVGHHPLSSLFSPSPPSPPTPPSLVPLPSLSLLLVRLSPFPCHVPRLPLLFTLPLPSIILFILTPSLFSSFSLPPSSLHSPSLPPSSLHFLNHQSLHPVVPLRNIQRHTDPNASPQQVKLSYKIDVHDYDVRKRAAKRFLIKGDKVKASIRFKGRYSHCYAWCGVI
jgi:hypothetical protein